MEMDGAHFSRMHLAAAHADWNTSVTLQLVADRAKGELKDGHHTGFLQGGAGELLDFAFGLAAKVHHHDWVVDGSCSVGANSSSAHTELLERLMFVDARKDAMGH